MNATSKLADNTKNCLFANKTCSQIHFLEKLYREIKIAFACLQFLEKERVFNLTWN